MTRQRSHSICLGAHPPLDRPDSPLAIDSLPLTLADISFSPSGLLSSFRTRSDSTGSQATIRPTSRQRKPWEMMQMQREAEETPKAERQGFDFAPLNEFVRKSTDSAKWPANSVLIDLGEDASYDHVPDVKEYLCLVGITTMHALLTNLSLPAPERRFDISNIRTEELVQVGRETLANSQRLGEG
ncbi:hypothetical protein IAR50_006583 [Cryptococcus sp. DSM 104548]